METLNTPDEIALWISASSAYTGTRTYPNADSAAQFADSMVLELRKRIPAAGLSGEPDVKSDPYPPGLDTRLQAAQDAGKCVRVTFANGDVSKGMVKRLADDYWALDTDEHFGTDAGFHDAERAVSVEILASALEYMSREAILRVACEALASGKQVRAKLRACWETRGSEDVTTAIYAIDGSDIPVCLTRPDGKPRWCHLACECPNDTEGLVSLEIIDLT
jgi:hypothetical protein